MDQTDVPPATLDLTELAVLFFFFHRLLPDFRKVTEILYSGNLRTYVKENKGGLILIGMVSFSMFLFALSPEFMMGLSDLSMLFILPLAFKTFSESNSMEKRTGRKGSINSAVVWGLVILLGITGLLIWILEGQGAEGALDQEFLGFFSLG